MDMIIRNVYEFKLSGKEIDKLFSEIKGMDLDNKPILQNIYKILDKELN